jgi:hypothetical protein
VPLDLKAQIKEITGQPVSRFLITAAREKMALIQNAKNPAA